MDRVSVAEAERDFASLVNRVYSEGTSIELQRGEETVAYLVSARPRSRLKVRDLETFLRGLPPLGDDADAFSADLRAIRRETPMEADPWE